ncbi:VOC family protein [Anaerocolumna sp.]|uniref:VOC family protein n=1 Tax=Anaerocolumna sp. TaxID=2041569 RepID=UPI0028AFFB47|nr:VOC family protein [Anaerocolumna sp.]
MKIHHIAYAVSSIENSKAHFELLGFSEIKKTIEDINRKIKICFLENREGGNNTVIELIESIDETSPISNLVKKMSGVATPYHICYEVDDIEDVVEEYKKLGFILTQNAAPAIAIDNRKVAFMFHKGVGIVEFVENK